MSDYELSQRPELLSTLRYSRILPFVIFGIIDGLAQMTIVEVKRTSLTHPGLRRVLIQCVLWAMELVIIARRSRQNEKRLAGILVLQI